MTGTSDVHHSSSSSSPLCFGSNATTANTSSTSSTPSPNNTRQMDVDDGLMLNFHTGDLSPFISDCQEEGLGDEQEETSDLYCGEDVLDFDLPHLGPDF